MATGKSVKANRINIVDPVFCLLLTDEKSGTATYGTVETLGEAMQVQLTPSLASGVLYGNGRQSENISKMTGIAMVLDLNKVPVEARAKISGHKYENGVMEFGAEDEAPNIAIGYKIEQTNKKVELVWLLKGRAQDMNSSVQQSTENLNFSTDSLTVNFVPRDCDNKLQYFADSSNPELTEKQANDWFKTGPSKAPLPALAP